MDSLCLLSHQESLIVQEPSWDDLKKPLIELILKFYNGEDQGNDFVNSLSTVIRVLVRWQMYGPINT